MRNISDDALNRAAHNLAEARRMQMDINISLGGVLTGYTGHADPVKRDQSLIKLLSQLSVQTAMVMGALTDIIGQELVETVQAEIEEDMPDAPAGTFFDSIVGSMIRNAPVTRSMASSASIATVHLPDRTMIWGCKSPLLGAALDKVFTQYLDAGKDLFLADTVESPDGSSYEKIVIPAGTAIEWTHTKSVEGDMSVIVTQVEDHVNRFGGVTLDADGHLIEPVPQDD